MLLGSLCSTGFFWKFENNVSVLSIVLNLQTVFPLKPMFSKGPSFFLLLFVIRELWICAYKLRPMGISLCDFWTIECKKTEKIPSLKTVSLFKHDNSILKSSMPPVFTNKTLENGEGERGSNRHCFLSTNARVTSVIKITHSNQNNLVELDFSGAKTDSRFTCNRKEATMDWRSWK